MDKLLLRSAILEKVSAELDNLTRAALLARDEATHEESKPENQYDMHAQEAAYLAEGQARLVKDLQETLSLYQTLPLNPWAPGAPVGIGAVVTLEAGKRRSYYFLGPRSGGIDVECEGREVTVVTPASPVGRQLLGATIGSTVTLPGRTGPVPHRISAVD
ncbi:transcription elongation factor [Opitutaceae bacterium EW11]|nr:transcription elongation factor [Opitutaceae bacterium EW11]